MPPELANAPTAAPDPATNTGPTDGGALAPNVSASTDWNFLDTPPVEQVDDRLEFREDREARLAAEAEAAESTEVTSEEPVAETPAETPTETPAEETPAVDPQIAQRAQEFTEFDQALRDDPALVAQVILEKLDARQRAEILSQFGVVEGRSAFDVESYEPNGDMETAIKERWQDLEAIPQVISETKRLESEMQENYQTFVPHITDANLSSQMALYQIEALCQALNVTLPAPDMTKLRKALEDPKVTYRDAVRKSVDYTKHIEAEKQKRVQRPKTPGNETTKREPYKEGISLVEIMSDMGYLRK